MFVDVLPWWERYTYWTVGISSIVYAVYTLFVEGEKFKSSLAQVPFCPGWRWIGRDQDCSDIEWLVWRGMIWKLLTLYAVHVLLSQVCRLLKVSEKKRTCVLLTCDLIAVYSLVGARIIVMQCSAALTIYAASFLGSIALIWVLALIMISSLNYETIYKFQLDYFKILTSEQEHLYVSVVAFFYLRLIIFCVEKVRYRKSKATMTPSQICNKKSENTSLSCSKMYKDLNTVDSDPSFLDLLFYSFYLPVYTDGPIVLYSDFHNQVKKSFQLSVFTEDIVDVVKKLIKIAFWALFIEFQFHFFYFSALSSYPAIVDRLSQTAVAAICYYQGQFFMVKYLVMYGLGVQISRFDGLVPIANPRCISWVYSYTAMWKYFDVGLHNFVKTYIYVPCGGSTSGLPRKIFGSGLVFTFIYIWHGATLNLLIWCGGNFLLGVFEAAAVELEKSAVGARLKSHLSPAMQLRLKAIFICPLYLACSLQIAFFFFGMEVSWSVVSRLITKASWTGILTQYACVTACIHNALYLTQRYEYKKAEKLKNI